MKFLAALIFISAITSSAFADTNIAPSGTPIFGYSAGGASLLVAGTNYSQYDGTIATLNDGTTTSEGAPNTTFGNSGSYGFAGFTGLVIPTGSAITSVNLFMYGFGDGGWFGPNNDTNPNNPLKDSDLSAPILQATVDNGLTWTNVVTTNNYLSQYDGTTSSAFLNSNLPEVTYDLTAPLAGVNGIRLIGTNGGSATNNGNPGFIAVNEVQVDVSSVPEPSTYAMIGLGLLALLALGKFRRLTA